MIVEVPELLAAALRHDTYGVNAQLESVPLREGHERPPDLVAVLEPTEDDTAARNPETPNEWPVVVVSWQNVGDVDGTVTRQNRDAGTYTLALSYVTRRADCAAAVRDAGYTLRAMLRTLRVLETKDPNVEGERTLRGVVLRAFKPMTVPGPIVVQKSGVGITAALLVTCEVRDTEP